MTNCQKIYIGYTSQSHVRVYLPQMLVIHVSDDISAVEDCRTTCCVCLLNLACTLYTVHCTLCTAAPEQQNSKAEQNSRKEEQNSQVAVQNSRSITGKLQFKCIFNLFIHTIQLHAKPGLALYLDSNGNIYICSCSCMSIVAEIISVQFSMHV